MKTWRDLDRATRKALLRGEPAADPETDWAAQVYAEKMLRQGTVRTLLVAAPVCIALGGLLGYASGTANLSSGVTVALQAAGIFLIMLAMVIVSTRRKLALIRILNVSREAPKYDIAPGSRERLEVRIPVGGVLRFAVPLLFVTIALVMLGLACMVAGMAGLGAPLAGIGVLVGIPVLAYLGNLLAWSLPGHPQFVLDTQGMHTPKNGVRVEWESIREIRVIPLRANPNDTRRVIAFLLHDNQVYLRQLPRWQAMIANMNTRTYLSPMLMTDPLVDKSIDVIAESAAALSGLPVSRSAQLAKP
ncbi:hypothetical protein [Nocardia sp. XZ_19_385]|uniref:hypothetical protein n=1 Tax=Nocardia sp. XZ_19_385 TaxID=2769488 RepID=UPI00188F7F6A|nr:hypothetical protein [Nocardia sp. XZ_19_385]